MLNIGCIHTDSRETVRMELNDAETFDMDPVQVGSLEVSNLIYTSSKLPLEDFFTRLESGEFTEAFKRIDFNYRPAKTDNKAIKELLNAGFVPVYVQVVNNGSSPAPYSHSNFVLSDGSREFKAISIADLPLEFEHFNPTALGANVFNTGVVVATVAAVIAVMLMAASKGSIGHIGGINEFPGSNRRVFNKTTKTTALDYQNYLLGNGTLMPNDVVRGLLFFQIPVRISDLQKLRLELQ